MRPEGVWLRCAIIIWFFACWPVSAGLYVNTISPGNVPWPGGTVPYVIDPALSPAQQQTYLNALREYELAANVHFIPRTSEAQYVLFKYDPTGFDSVSGSNPQVVAVSSLTRSQICHEMGHSFGLLHEHTRADQNTYVNVLSTNITAGNQHWFDIDPNGTAQGSYDFESVMHFRRDLFSVQPGVLDTLQAKLGFEKFQPRMDGLALSKGDRAVMKFLYGAGPTLSPVVTNTSESGVGGLRAAMHYAVDNPGATITFNIPTSDPNYANGVFTIRPTGHLLPFVVDGTIIDGTTQPGYAGSPLLVLDGSQILPEAELVPGSVPGMLMYAANCTVKGLSFQRFPWVGLALLLPDAHNNAVRGCWFGLNYSGTASAPNQYQGIQISSGANSNTIGGTTTADRNVLSGNAQYGIWISDANTTGNVVLGNYIGTSASGLAAVPNGSGGLIVTGSSHDNSIGGTSVGARNVISGNVDTGVWLIGAGVNQNTVRGNYIGLAATGNAAVPNTMWGVDIRNGAQNNLVADNVISGNTDEGLRIENAGTSGNMVQGNQVGTAPGGSSAIGNGFAGVTVFTGATGNIIGGTTAAQRNILSGNGTVGLVFADSGTTGNIAQGNFIGTDVSGTASVPNGFAGVYITNGAVANYLGDVQPGAGNLISGNAAYGVWLADPGTNGNFVRGNFIGISANGAAALANAYSGIRILNGAQSNVIGGAVGGRNIISGNGNYGIVIADAGTNSNLVRGNTIGMNATGGSPVPNAWQGIEFQGGAVLNQIGGSALGDSNLIAGNTLDGVILFDAATKQNKLSQNSIFSNGGKGIVLTSANSSQPAPTSLSGSVSTASNPNGTDVSGFAGGASTLEFFASPTGDPSGFGEGQFFIDSLSVGGSGSFTAHLAAIVPAGYVIAATSTDGSGNTSEFSQTFTVPAYSDNGNDGTPDQWMLAHFLHVDPQVGDKSRATDDADGDGLTNLQEFLAGTDPRSASSALRISAVDKIGNGFRVSFASVNGKTYRLEYRDDLVTGSWGTLVDQMLGTGGTLQISDPSATGLTRRFYRIAIEP